MKVAKSALLLMALLGFASVSSAQSKYGHLKTWANEYPLKLWTKPKVNFFALPEIRQPLLNILGTQNFQRLMADLGQVTPINVIDGYLIIQGNSEPHKTPPEEQEEVTVAVSLNDREGSIYVIFSGRGQSGRAEYHCTGGTNCSRIFLNARIKCR